MVESSRLALRNHATDGQVFDEPYRFKQIEYTEELWLTRMLTLFVLLLLICRVHSRPTMPCRVRRRTTALPAPTRRRCKPAWVKQEIIRLKALTDFSCHKLAATFNRMHSAERGVTVGKTWVANTVRAHRYEIAQLRQRYKRRIPPPLPRNAACGLDYTGKMATMKTVYPVFGVIDHGTRVALALRPLHERTAVTTLKALLLVIETFGLPQTIRTDNDAVFTSRLFRFALRWLGIRHRLSTPGCPWQNGRIERLFGTLKEKLNKVSVPDFPALDRAMMEFRFWYNHIRPHQHLNGWTPAEAWVGLDPYRHPPRATLCFHAWDGLLEGIYLRR